MPTELNHPQELCVLVRSYSCHPGLQLSFSGWHVPNTLTLSQIYMPWWSGHPDHRSQSTASQCCPATICFFFFIIYICMYVFFVHVYLFKILLLYRKVSNQKILVRCHMQYPRNYGIWLTTFTPMPYKWKVYSPTVVFRKKLLKLGMLYMWKGLDLRNCSIFCHLNLCIITAP